MTIIINNPAAAPRPRGRPRAFDRDVALATAGTLFWQRGYEGASIADLTAAMGITPQSLYAAFRSKADLYREALDWYHAEVGPYVGEALEQPDVFVAFEHLLMGASRAFTRADRPRGCMVAAAGLACAVENRDVAAIVADLRDAGMAAFRARIERGVADGMLAPQTDAAALARFVGAVFQGMAVQARDGASEAELASVATLALAELRRHGTRCGRAAGSQANNWFRHEGSFKR